MKRVFTTMFAFMIIASFASSGYTANTKGWLGVTTGKGKKIAAPGIKLTEHADAPTHSDLADGVIYADTDDNLYYRAGGAWVDLTVQAGAGLTLDGAFDNGKVINGANSSANAMQVGDGTDAILMHTEGAGDVRITTNGTSDLTIAPDGGDTDITGTLSTSGALDVATGGLTVTAGGITVTAGGIDIDAGGFTVAGGATVEDTGLTIDAGGLTVSGGGVSVVGGVTADAATVTGNITTSTGDLVASAGEADITGGASNEDLIDVTRNNSASGGDGIDIDMGSAAIAGDAIDIAFGGAATGDGILLNMTNNLAGNAIDITGAGARTAPIINIASNGSDGGTDDNVVRIIQDGSLDSDVMFIQYTSANSPGNAIGIDMNTNLAGEGIYIDVGGGARTGSAIEINDDGTGTHDAIDINMSGSGVTTGLNIQGSYNGSPAGALIGLVLDDGDNLDTSVIAAIVGTGARGALISYTGTQTDSGTTSHVIDLDQTGVLDSNVIDITYDTGASTGQAIDINMATNVAGMAISIASAATGVDNEGSGIDIDSSGNLIQGANVLRIDSSGDMAHADTRVVEINETGADQASSYTIDINSTNNGGLVVSAAAADNAILVEQGLTTFGGNKVNFFDAAVGVYSQADTFLDIFADGALRIGDSSGGAPTNYTNISATGSITLLGSARETKTIFIPAQAFQNVSGAAQGLVGIAGVWQLSDAASDSLTTSFAIPNNYVEGTDMTCKVHWSSAQISNTATFDGAYLAVVAGEDTSAAGNLFTQEDDAANGTADYLNITEGFTIGNANIDKADQVILNIIRLGSDGNDDLTDDVDFQGVAITYTADRI